MVEATEMSERVVAELEEFWFNNIFSIINTLWPKSGDWSEIDQFKRVLSDLVQRGDLSIGLESFYPRNEQLLEQAEGLLFISDLERWFKYDPATQHWRLGIGDFKTVRYPFIRITPQGLQRARAILSKRGWHWWEQK